MLEKMLVRVGKRSGEYGVWGKVSYLKRVSFTVSSWEYEAAYCGE